MINFYLYLPDFLTQVFSLTQVWKRRGEFSAQLRKSCSMRGARKKLPRNYLDLSLPLCPLSVAIPFVKVQRDSPVQTAPHSSQLSCRAVRTVSTLHTSDFQFSYDTDSQEFTVLSNWSSINKMQNFKYKIYNIFYNLKIFYFFD